jgi:predicted ATP-grasp superfamily ATP-dependent carboligase
VTDFAQGPLFELFERPDLERPVLLVHLEGWIDAGGAAQAAVNGVLGERGSSVIARFDTEQLLDHRARRPVMHINDGVNTGLTWPEITLELAADREGTPFLVLHGPEPDHNWRRFTGAVASLALELDARLVVGFGAYPSATPHTRPSRLSAIATDRALAAQVGYTNATLDIPAGVQAAIERACVDYDIPAIGLWAQVPHYAASMPYPAAAAALLDGVRIVAGLQFDASALHEQAVATRSRIDEMLDRNDEHQEMVRQLEAQDDAIRRADEQELPTGDELAAEVEQFLREQDE